MTDELERKSIMVQPTCWREAQKKAGVLPMSALIRKLLERYVEEGRAGYPDEQKEGDRCL